MENVDYVFNCHICVYALYSVQHYITAALFINIHNVLFVAYEAEKFVSGDMV